MGDEHSRVRAAESFAFNLDTIKSCLTGHLKHLICQHVHQQHSSSIRVEPSGSSHNSPPHSVTDAVSLCDSTACKASLQIPWDQPESKEVDWHSGSHTNKDDHSDPALCCRTTGVFVAACSSPTEHPSSSLSPPEPRTRTLTHSSMDQADWELKECSAWLSKLKDHHSHLKLLLAQKEFDAKNLSSVSGHFNKMSMLKALAIPSEQSTYLEFQRDMILIEIHGQALCTKQRRMLGGINWSTAGVRLMQPDLWLEENTGTSQQGGSGTTSPPQAGSEIQQAVLQGSSASMPEQQQQQLDSLGEEGCRVHLESPNSQAEPGETILSPVARECRQGRRTSDGGLTAQLVIDPPASELGETWFGFKLQQFHAEVYLVSVMAALFVILHAPWVALSLPNMCTQQDH